MGATIVVAFDQRALIGIDDHVPWDDAEERAWFKQLTTGIGTVIMGRKTWLSLPEQYRPLPDRHNVVLSRNLQYQITGPGQPGLVPVYTTLHQALVDNPSAAVIGGAEVYEAAMTSDLVNRVVASEMQYKWAKTAHRLPNQAYFPYFRLKFHGWAKNPTPLHIGGQFVVYEYIHKRRS